MAKDDPFPTSTLRPGLLVSLKTSITGNVKYDKKSIRDEFTPDGANIREWETTRTIYDPEEHKRATKVRQNARNKVADACISTGFGLLCPADKREALAEAVAAARAEVRAFNASTNWSTVRIYVIAGYIADNDAEALKAIASEVNDLMRAMEEGIDKLDAEAIREAASRAMKVGKMLQPEAAEEVKEAVKLAREQARKITKAGESAAQVVDQTVIKAISTKRTAFLDMAEADDELVVNIKGTGRAVELEPALPPEEVEEVAAPKRKRGKVTRERLAPASLDV